jgi:hypothetical protein
MSHRGRYALYLGFVTLTLAAVLSAPLFSPALARMTLIPYSVLAGAMTFALVTLYQGIAARLGVLPFRPAKWILRLFRIADDRPPHR